MTSKFVRMQFKTNKLRLYFYDVYNKKMLIGSSNNPLDDYYK